MKYDPATRTWYNTNDIYIEPEGWLVSPMTNNENDPAHYRQPSPDAQLEYFRAECTAAKIEASTWQKNYTDLKNKDRATHNSNFMKHTATLLLWVCVIPVLLLIGFAMMLTPLVAAYGHRVSAETSAWMFIGGAVVVGVLGAVVVGIATEPGSHK